MKIIPVNLQAAMGSAFNQRILVYRDKARSLGYDFEEGVGTAAVFSEFGDASPALTLEVTLVTGINESAIVLRAPLADMSASGLVAGSYVWNCKITPDLGQEPEEWLRGSFEILPQGV
jgi:hypothetical protein